MKNDNSCALVVLVGSFNTQILRDPKWIKQFLIPDSKQENLEFKLNLEMLSEEITSSVEIDDIKFEVKKGRFSITPKKLNSDSFRKVYKIISNISKNIPHTPIIAYGINFSFLETSNKSYLLTPNNSILLDCDNKNTELELKQIYPSDDCLISFTISERKIRTKRYEEKLKFNFHVQIKNNPTEALNNLVQSKLIEKYLSVAQKHINYIFHKTKETQK